MEAEHGSARDADAIARDGAQHERAGRETRPVDDHPLAGLTHARKRLKIVADIAARARQDAQIRVRLRHCKQGQDGGKNKASHSDVSRVLSRARDRGLKLSGSFAACRASQDPLQAYSAVGLTLYCTASSLSWPSRRRASN